MVRVLCVAAFASVVVSVSLIPAAGAVANKPRGCPNSEGGAGRLIDTFSQVKATGVSCRNAREVLGTWANSAPGGTDLGFICTARKRSKNVYDLRCTERGKLITARDTEKT